MCLQQALANAVRHARFELFRVPEPLSAERLVQSIKFLPHWQRAGMRVTLPPEAAQPLHAGLRNLLHRYIDPDSGVVGSNLEIVLSGFGRGKTVEEFSDSLVLAATLGDPERAVQHLVEWVDGAPLRGRSMTLLQGIVIEENREFPLATGISLRRLPNGEDLFDFVPEMLIGSRAAHGIGGPGPQVHEFAGQPVLCREFAVQPVLYEPPSAGEPPPLPAQEHAGLGRDWVTALALACDLPVEASCAWNLYDEDVAAFAIASSGSVVRWKHYSLPLQPQNALTADQVTLAKETADRLWEAAPTVHAAVRRWLNSKKEGALDDRFIELRIALEALYTEGSENLRFAVATRAARHLADPGDGRRNLFTEIRKFYDRASGFIHVDRMRKKGRQDDATEEMCRSVQGTVREGILKMLSDGQPDLIDLSLGQ